MSDLQRLYGLVVASEYPLHQDRPVPTGTPVDVRVRWGAERTTAEQAVPVEGRVLLEVGWDGRVDYVALERPDGTTLLRFTGTCDMELAADLSDVVVHPVEGADRGIAVVLTTGAMLAFQLYRRGHAVLHASAVAVPADGDAQAAIAFVGASGGGKSTMATLMCSDGARLVTDDVLRVDTAGAGRPTVHLGATGLRLRKGADSLASLFPDAPAQRRSADLRHVLSPRSDAPDLLPLAAVVVPAPDRGITELALERLAPKDALFDLLSFPRLLGWRDPVVLREHLGHLSALVAQVPVFRAQVPWGPPFSPDVAPALREAVLQASPSPSSATSGR